MFDPFSGPVLVRGAIIQKEDNSLTIHFQQSSAFWDESDIGFIDKDLVLIDVKDASRFSEGDTIIA